MNQLVIISPLPPTKSGIADYVFEQLPFLSEYFDITMVVDDNETPKSLPSNIEVYHKTEFLEIIDNYKNCPFLYHIGNNVYHEHCIDIFRKRKGIIVLHDYCLHHLVTELTLARNDFESYKAILSESHGELGVKIAENRRRGIYNELIPFIFPANKFLLKNAEGIIVHSEWALTNVRINTNEKVRAVRIPMHYKGVNDSLDAMTKATARDQLSLDKNKIIFSSAGFITPPKQIQLVLKALGKIKDSLPEFEYIMIGEPYDKDWLEKLIEENDLQGIAKYTGYISLDKMQSYISASDFSICLRYPSAGETSATLMRCLGMGIPSIVFNYSSYSDFPDNVVYKIKLDTHNLEYLSDAITDLSCNRDLRERYKSHILKYVRDDHNIDNVINHYTKFINKISAASKELNAELT